MSKHPAVKFLTAALARAEETAKAATAGPWTAHRYTWDGDGFEASIGHYSEADVIGHGYEGDAWPCRTVLLLAQAWGWEEEQRG